MMNKEYMGVERVSAPMQVVKAIRDAIRRGELKEGDRLPSETVLANQLGVGRSSYREGMRILNAYGVVEIRQGEGTYIINKCAERVFEFMGFFPEDNTNLRMLIDLRRILEIGSLQLAASKVSRQDIAKLESLVEEMNESISYERNIYLDKSFHELLISLTGNELLVQIYSMLSQMQANLMSQLMCHSDVVHDAKLSHERILNALKDGNVKEVTQAMGEHLDNVASYSEMYIG